MSLAELTEWESEISSRGGRNYPVRITQDAVTSAITYAKNDPNGYEVVGVFRGDLGKPLDEFISITNIHPGNGDVYVVHPQEIMDAIRCTTAIKPKTAQKWCMFFHSHPKWLAYPSTTDLHNAAFQGFYSIYSNQYDELNAFYFDGTMWKPRLLWIS